LKSENQHQTSERARDGKPTIANKTGCDAAARQPQMTRDAFIDARLARDKHRQIEGQTT
jgi:hypothetical protein